MRVELPSATVVHWSVDGWRTAHDTPTEDSGFGIHFASVFTIYWPAENRWEGVDYQLAVG